MRCRSRSNSRAYSALHEERGLDGHVEIAGGEVFEVGGEPEPQVLAEHSVVGVGEDLARAVEADLRQVDVELLHDCADVRLLLAGLGDRHFARRFVDLSLQPVLLDLVVHPLALLADRVVEVLDVAAVVVARTVVVDVRVGDVLVVGRIRRPRQRSVHRRHVEPERVPIVEVGLRVGGPLFGEVARLTCCLLFERRVGLPGLLDGERGLVHRDRVLELQPLELLLFGRAAELDEALLGRHRTVREVVRRRLQRAEAPDRRVVVGEAEVVQLGLDLGELRERGGHQRRHLGVHRGRGAAGQRGHHLRRLVAQRRERRGLVQG